MKMTFLGTGGTFSRSGQNYHNNVLVETDAGSKILIDCGTTALESLHALSVDPLELDGVIVTHIHADHVGGLEELGFRGLFLGKALNGSPTRFDLYVPGPLLPSKLDLPYESDRLPDLWENCLKGGMVHVQDEQNNPVTATLETYFVPHVMETPEEVFTVDGVRFMFVRTKHVPQKASFGLVMESERGSRIFFSGDTLSDVPVDLGEFDVIFHDCLWVPKYPSTVHTHFEEMVSLPQDTRERVFLMHYGGAEDAPENLEGMRLAHRHQTFDL